MELWQVTLLRPLLDLYHWERYEPLHFLLLWIIEYH